VDSPAIGLRDAGTWALMLCATLVAHLPALRGGLLWDDNMHVTRADLRSLHGLWRIWSDLGALQQYYPLLHSAFWLEHRIWGDATLYYHLTNVALHAASACLVVMIVRRLRLPGAWLAGFVFALHPVCVEAVAWISEQKSTLSGVFYLAAALAYLRFDRGAPGARRRSQYFIALGLFVLALLSKTVTATLPAALLVVLWWQRGRLNWRRDVLPLVPWLALGASAGLFTVWVERTLIGAKGVDFDLSLIQRVLLAGRVIWFYAGKLAWPANLIFTYPHWTIDPGVWWQYLFVTGVLAVVVGLGLVARRHRGPLAAFLIFAGTLFPVLGFLNVYPFRYSYVADHFQYLASLGIIVPVASGLTVAVRKISPRKAGRIVLPALLPMILGLLTWRQSAMYRDTETLYRETLARNPASWMAHNNLGEALSRIPGRLPDAIAEYEEALRIRPDDAEAHNNLGNVLSQIPGRLPDSIAHFQAALRIDADYAEAHNNLGNTLSKIPGRLPDAIAEYEAALRIRPDYAAAHNNLGTVLSQVPGRLPDAIAHFQAAFRIEADYAEAHYNLGLVLADSAGRLQDAITEYEAALRINPDLADAHDNLGKALSQLPGRLPDAVAQYEAALRIDPHLAEAHYNLGNALSELPGRLQDAIAHYEMALRIDPDLAEAHTNLGNALSQLPGRLPDAIVHYEAALRIDPNLAEAHYNLGNALAELLGRLRDAIGHYQAALQINPDYAEAHINLGNALSQLPGRLPDAIAHYEAALRINPDLAEAHINLGNALSELPGRLRDAIAHYEAALRIRPDPELSQTVNRLRAGYRTQGR